jgi:hypothetical protein
MASSSTEVQTFFLPRGDSGGEDDAVFPKDGIELGFLGWE